MQEVVKVFGAPGCGKTRRLLDLLQEELKTHDPRRVAFVSFTRKGTYEGVERAKASQNLTDADLPYFRTLHSLAFRDGKFSRYDMIDKRHYKEFSVAMNMKFTGHYTEEFYGEDDKYLFMYSLRRNNPRMAAVYEAAMNVRLLGDVERNFVRYKEYAHIVDFTDIVDQFVKRGEALPVDVAFIDEAQDLTTLQWQMCEVAFKNCERVYVAGDDDQAVYEWSGADVEYFLNLAADRQEILAKSWRLQRSVLELAKSISSKIKRRVPKDFEPVGDEGRVFVYNSLDEVDVTQGETWYFLARNNWFLQYYRDFLKKRARVFIDKNDLSVNPRHIEAINTYERARKRGKTLEVDDVKLKLYLNPRHSLQTPWYENMNFEPEQSIYYRDLIRTKADLKDQKLMVNTIHGVKGGEADNVVLMLDYTKAVGVNVDRNPDAELRCLYVAMTRAKKNLHIIYSSSRRGYDNWVRVS
jgi:superfamily I DNA/RNA helicase